MNSRKYNIVVALREIEGESIFEGRALEFPEVRVYESDFTEAYSQVLEVIEDLIAMSIEMGHVIPSPIPDEPDSFSGKMTFRPGKMLHRKIVEAAKHDGISQNNLLCNLVSSAIEGQDLSNKLSQRLNQLTDSINQNISGYFRHHAGRQFQTVAQGVTEDEFSGLTDVTSGSIGLYIGMREPKLAEDNDVPFNLLISNVRNTGYGQS